jgi:hypothetical protein
MAVVSGCDAGAFCRDRSVEGQKLQSLSHIIAAHNHVVIGETFDDKAVVLVVREADGQAAVSRAMAGAGRTHSPVVNFAP